MTIREFFALLGCAFSLSAAVGTANRQAFDATEARIDRIHAEIDARKAAR